MHVGKIYFYTATIYHWHKALENTQPKEIILSSLAYLKTKKAAEIYAFVIMPNHLHIIWRPLLENVQLRFMKYTSQKIKLWIKDQNMGDLKNYIVNKKDRTYQIWQRNSLAVELYSPHVIEQKLDYIHNNPCQGKWMLADDPISYPWSSAAFYENDDRTYSFLTHYGTII